MKVQMYLLQSGTVTPQELFHLEQMRAWYDGNQHDVHHFFMELTDMLQTEHMVNLNLDPLAQPPISPTWQQYQASLPTPVTELLVSQFVIRHTCLSCQTLFTQHLYFKCACAYLENTQDVIIEPADHLDGRQCTQCQAPEPMCSTEMTRCPPFCHPNEI